MCRTLAEQICASIQSLVPAVSTTENSVSSRAGKVYLDPSQNDYADTLASVYSVRPYHQPTVSAPLEWKEVNGKLDPAKFDIRSILERIKKKGDLFEGVTDGQTRKKNSTILKKFL